VIDGKEVFATIAGEAAEESSLWGDALLPRARQDPIAIFSPLGCERFALATETIYEGYLLHYGRPRLFAPADGDAAVLLGDYLYAHGLVRLARNRDVGAVLDLAELISLCGKLRAEGAPAEADAAAWAATAALLGAADAYLELARGTLRIGGDAAALSRLAADRVGEDALALAVGAHRARVE
jgi:hypothetical protein